MSYFGRLAWNYALRPRRATLPNVPHNFMVSGDYQAGDDPGTIPSEVTRQTVDLPFAVTSACAYKQANHRIVLASETPDRQFSYSDDYGGSWNGSSVPGFASYVDRIFYLEDKDMFIGVAHDDVTRILISFDGANWSIPQSVPMTGTNFGFAYSGSEIVISFDGTFDNILRSTDGQVWTKHTSPSSSGMSLVWHAPSGVFLGFLDGTNQYYSSPDGITWSGPNIGPDILHGPYSAAIVNSDRILVLGSTRNAAYSDDGGNTWVDASGFTTNTGVVNRYVANSGDTLYVALTVSVNLGYLSLDNGATWQAAYHLSGNVSGVAVVA